MSTHSQYTEHPEIQPTVVFPRESVRLVCLIFLLFAYGILLYILGRRAKTLNPVTHNDWRSLNVARLACLMVYTLSTAYLFGSLMIIFGTGMSKNSHTCGIGTLLCLIFYTCSKFWLYLFLLEKVRIVQAVKKPRLKSKSYLAMLTMLSIPCLAIFFEMIFARRHDVDGDGVCHMGLEEYSTISVLVFDLMVVSFLTFMFCRPLLRSRNEMVSPMIRRVALKSLVASLTSVTSTASLCLYLIIKKRKLGWLCLLTCALDIAANAIVLFCVTMRTEGEGSSNGNQEREKMAIDKFDSGNNNAQDSGGNGDHLDMMEALRGDLHLAEIGRPSLRCACSLTSLAVSSDALEQQSTHSAPAKTRAQSADRPSIGRNPSTGSTPSVPEESEDKSRAVDDVERHPVISLSYQSSAGSSVILVSAGSSARADVRP